MRKIELEQGSPEWLEWRKSHFMASETAQMMDKSPFGNSLELAHIKFGNLKVYENQAMRDGRKAEAWIRDDTNYIHGANFQPLVVEWSENPKFGASLDGFDDGVVLDGFNDGVVLEIKYSNLEYEQVFKHKKPSEHYMLQVQHQLLVTEARECLFVAVNKDNGLRAVCVVKPDKSLQKAIIKAWEKWEAKYKDKELEPLENEIGPNDEKAEIWQEKALNLIEIQSKIKELQTAEKELKDSLISLSDGQKTRGYGVLVYPTERTSYSYAKFIKDNDIKISDEYKSVTTSWSVKAG